MKYKLEDFDPKNNKTVCVSAWSHLHASTDGKVYNCCMNSDKPMGDYEDESLKDIWNGEEIKKFRVKTLNGIKQSQCNLCYQQEEMGIHSFRVFFWDMFNNKEILESTKEDGTVDDINLTYWDFRFSNVCNLKCRTCGPVYSSTWGEELSRVKPEENGGHSALRRGNGTNILKSLEDENQYQKVESIYFAGGEPLIMNEHYVILDNLKKYNRTDVKISYNTNFMNLFFKKTPVWDFWNKFDNIQLQTSIDGLDSRGEYIRKGFKMETYKTNLNLVRTNSPHVKIGASIAVSILNTLHIFDLIDTLINDLKFNPHLININFVFGPSHYNPQNLTTDLKNKWLSLYEKEIVKYIEPENTYFPVYNNIKSILYRIKTFLFEKETDEVQVGYFKNQTEFYDNVRGENFKEVFPELISMVNAKIV